MRYSIPVKFLAVLLCAVALTAAFMSTLGIVQVADLGLYTDGFDSWVSNRLQWQAYDLAKSLTERFAVRALTNCSEEFLEELIILTLTARLSHTGHSSTMLLLEKNPLSMADITGDICI